MPTDFVTPELQAHIARLVAAAPPLTAHQRVRLAVLLHAPTRGAAARGQHRNPMSDGQS